MSKQKGFTQEFEDEAIRLALTRELQELAAHWGFAVGRRRIARLMRENDIKARQKRRFKRTTDSEHSWPVAPNIIDQDFGLAPIKWRVSFR